MKNRLRFGLLVRAGFGICAFGLHPVARTLASTREAQPLPLAPQTTLRERAEDLSNVTLTPTNPVYPVVQSAVVAEGDGAFHLAHPGHIDHVITLNTPVLVEPGAHAFFESRLRYAASDQVARFEVSPDAGVSWYTLWSQPGDGESGEAFFNLVEVDIDAYVGETLYIRFYYALTGPHPFSDTELNVGWFIDNIQVGPAFLSRPYTGVGDPTALEVLSVEFINRARADAAAEAQRLRNDDDEEVLIDVIFCGVDFDEMEAQFATLAQVAQPLAINSRLMAASRLHSQDMLDNAFQGHLSSDNPPPPHQPNDFPANRAHYQGYQSQYIRENVAATAQSVWHAHAGFNINWGFGTPHGMQIPPAHRMAIHSPAYREIGIGILEGFNHSVGPVLVTQKFGVEQNLNQPFLVGVAYEAHDNDFYDAAFALSNVMVSVAGCSAYAMSSTYGAYAVPLPGDGKYTVTFSVPGYVPFRKNFTVSDGWNVKLDYVAQPGPEGPWIEAFNLRPDGGMRFETVVAGDVQTWRVRISPDFENWNDHAADWIPLGGYRYRVDCAPICTPAAFFKVVSDP